MYRDHTQPATHFWRSRGLGIAECVRCRRVRATDVLRDREGAGVDDLVPRLAGAAAAFGYRSVRPIPQAVERLGASCRSRSPHDHRSAAAQTAQGHVRIPRIAPGEEE
jgi:hypothetical protein